MDAAGNRGVVCDIWGHRHGWVAGRQEPPTRHVVTDQPMGMRFSRVTIDPDVMGGMPCIRGLRIPVATVVAMVADQMTPAEILAELPDLEEDDVAEALRYAAEAVRERELPLRPTA